MIEPRKTKWILGLLFSGVRLLWHTTQRTILNKWWYDTQSGLENNLQKYIVQYPVMGLSKEATIDTVIVSVAVPPQASMATRALYRQGADD